MGIEWFKSICSYLYNDRIIDFLFIVPACFYFSLNELEIVKDALNNKGFTWEIIQYNDQERKDFDSKF